MLESQRAWEQAKVDERSIPYIPSTEKKYFSVYKFPIHIDIKKTTLSFEKGFFMKMSHYLSYGNLGSSHRLRNSQYTHTKPYMYLNHNWFHMIWLGSRGNQLLTDLCFRITIPMSHNGNISSIPLNQNLNSL